MYKFFVNDEQIQEDTVIIENEDVNHIKNVLRIGINEKIQICNINSSKNYLCEILEEDTKYIKCKIINKINCTTEANTYIHVFQGLPKAEKMEDIVQKLTELGIRQITPVFMERCIVKLDEKAHKKRIERLQKIAEAAAKQSKRDMIPLINYCIDIENLSNQLENFDLIITAYEEEKNNKIRDVLKGYKDKRDLKVALIIGPEGGISLKEVKKLQNANSQFVTLGPRILRTQTAPIVLSSIILYELNDI